MSELTQMNLELAEINRKAKNKEAEDIAQEALETSAECSGAWEKLADNFKELREYLEND